MFSKNVLHVEILSLELHKKTERWLENMRGPHNGINLQHSEKDRQEIMDRGIRLMECVEGNSAKQVNSESVKHTVTKDNFEQAAAEHSTTPGTPSDNEDLINESVLSSPSNFPNVFSDSGIDVTEEDRAHDTTMNGLTAGHNNCEPFESISALRATLRHLKETTDKAVVRFLVQSRQVLRDEVKSQSDIERDEKLLTLISDLLRNKHEAERHLKDMSGSYEEGNPLSLLEKSLCYVLVDKALLNCLLVLDKALMEGKLSDRELSGQFGTVSSGQKLVSEFSQALNEKRQFIELRDELRAKEALVVKMRTQIRELSSEKLRLENENKSLEEKSRSWQLKSEDGAMRNSVIDSDRKRLKEKVVFLEESMNGLQSSTEHLRQQLQVLEAQDDAARLENERLKEKLHICSEELKRGVETGKPSKISCHHDERTSNMTMTMTIDSLLNENQKLRSKLEALETDDYELREKLTTLVHAHTETIQMKNEEIRDLKEQTRTLGDDLEGRLTEIVLLKAQLVELQSKGESQTAGDSLDCAKQFQDDVLNGALAERELQRMQELSHRAKSSEHRVEEYTTLLEELTKRKEILVNKLEMVGAVTVIRNDFDAPDGYTEAIDGVLRSQSSLIEKGVLSILSEREQGANERHLLEEENRRLKFTTEALETENLLLQVQVSDLTQTVEELEDDVINMKCGKTGKRSVTSGHRVTFESDKKEDDKLESLIQNAKQRCVNLERQIRNNTSMLKTTQNKNENLLKNHEDLSRENCNLRRYLDECHTTNKILHIKISELEERLQSVDDGKSLDEMEKQSLLDRLKIFEGQIKYLKVEKESMRNRMESFQRDSSDEKQSSQSAYSKFLLLENDDASATKSGLLDEIERLKNKLKRQSAKGRILKSEMFEFLDDIRCLESELGSVVDEMSSSEQSVDQSESKGTVPVGETAEGSSTESNTWGMEMSLCQEDGMAPVMIEIVEHLKSTAQRLQRISGNVDLSPDNGVRRSSSESQKNLRNQLSNEIAELRNEKLVLQREVLVLKAISENMLEPQSPEDVYNANEKDRSRYLRKQVLDSVQRNSELEGQILDYLSQKWALESELDKLKERILNLKDEKDVLLLLSDGPSCVSWGKSYETSMRNFCFVKNHGNDFEVHDVLRIEPDLDNEDVFSCPSDDGVCHSPDREASSCDSGYNSGRYDESHILNDTGDITGQKGDVTVHSRRPFYENTRGAHVSDSFPALTANRKPKGILKKRSVNCEHGSSSSQKLSVA